MLTKCEGAEIIGFCDIKKDPLKALALHFEIDLKVEYGEILYAEYNSFSYEGEAFVLLKRGDVLMRVDASHCSCVGLEGQWRPEITSIEVLEKGFFAANKNKY